MNYNTRKYVSLKLENEDVTKVIDASFKLAESAFIIMLLNNSKADDYHIIQEFINNIEKNLDKKTKELVKKYYLNLAKTFGIQSFRYNGEVFDVKSDIDLFLNKIFANNKKSIKLKRIIKEHNKMIERHKQISSIKHNIDNFMALE